METRNKFCPAGESRPSKERDFLSGSMETNSGHRRISYGISEWAEHQTASYKIHVQPTMYSGLASYNDKSSQIVGIALVQKHTFKLYK